MKLIAKHLDEKRLKLKIHNNLKNQICSFTGEKIDRGVLFEDLISDLFTDFSYKKNDSKYVSVTTALCVSDVIQGKTRNNSLRNYSYYADDNELRFLSRGDIWDLLQNIPNTPFNIAVSYNQKKHTSYKCIDNYDKDIFVITTDLYNVLFDRNEVNKYKDIIQNWYTIIPDKAETSAQPTYFTKEEILNGNAMYQKQVAYGMSKYVEENEFLNEFRGTQIFEFIVHILNKKIQND